MNKSEDIENQAKKLLDQSLAEINPEISRRLQQSRFAALEKAKPRTNWIFNPRAATALFAVAIISVSVWFNTQTPDFSDTTLAMESDIEILTDHDALELLEDMEFMQWLLETETYAS